MPQTVISCSHAHIKRSGVPGRTRDRSCTIWFASPLSVVVRGRQRRAHQREHPAARALPACEQLVKAESSRVQPAGWRRDWRFGGTGPG